MNKILIVFVLVSPACLADWRLDSNNSHLSFISIKNGLVAEAHRFDSLSGGVTREGRVTVNIDLLSLETNIPIRNDRMKSLLFEVDSYATATAKALVEISEYANLAPSQSVISKIGMSFDLHGVSQSIYPVVKVIRVDQKIWQVMSIEPLVLNAATHNLMEGIEALRAIAGLKEITPVVPITFSLQFSKN